MPVSVQAWPAVVSLLRDGSYWYAEYGWPSSPDEQLWNETVHTLGQILEHRLRTDDSLSLEERLCVLSSLEQLAGIGLENAHRASLVYAEVDRLFGAGVSCRSLRERALWLTLLASCNMWLDDADYTAAALALARDMLARPTADAVEEAMVLTAVNGYAYRMLDHRFDDELAVRVAALLQHTPAHADDTESLSARYAFFSQGVSFAVPRAVLQQLAREATVRLETVRPGDEDWYRLASLCVNYAYEFAEAEIEYKV